MNHASKTIKTIASAAIRMQDLQLLCLGIEITVVGFDAAELGSLGGKLGSFWFTLVTE